MKNKSQKEYVVIGLGRFGSSVAKQLEANGCKVLAIDRREKQVQQVAEYVTLAMCVDVTNEEAMEELGGRNFDGAVISMGHSLEASVLAAIWAKEQGIPLVIAKVYDDMQSKILLKLGVDQTICPEKEMGVHWGNNLAFQNLFESIELTCEYSIADIPGLEGWIGKSLRELKLREKYGINVIAMKRGGALLVNPPANAPTKKDDVFVVLGMNQTLKKLAHACGAERSLEKKVNFET